MLTRHFNAAGAPLGAGHSEMVHRTRALYYLERRRVGGRQIRGLGGCLNVGDGPVATADARALADFGVASLKRGARDAPGRGGPGRSGTRDHCVPDSSILG